jgi:hypothetical protein
VGADDRGTEDLLQALERSAHAPAAEPGFLAASLHVSDDATIVIWKQWADDASRRASHPRQGGEVQRDIATHQPVYVRTAGGGLLPIEAGSRVATLIDVMVTDPARQKATLGFNIANARALAEQPGYRSTAVLRGRDGTRAAAYAQWDRVEDWLAAVKTTGGERLPALRAAGTIQELNAALREASREMGSIPEYHAYRVTAVIDR